MSKSIKQVAIKVSTTGADSAIKELKTLNSALEESISFSRSFSQNMMASSKFLGNAAVAYRNINKAVDDSSEAIKKLNRAMNGDTVKAAKGINSYIDNVTILNAYLADLEETAKKAAISVASVGSNNSNTEEMVTILKALLDTVESMDGSLHQLNENMELVEKNTGKAATRIKQARDNITSLDVTTNRGNEALADLGGIFGSVGKKAKQTSDNINTTNNRLRNFNGTGSQSARAFSKLAFSMNPLTAAYASIAINVYALSEAFRFLKDAAALDRLINQTAQFSASVSGINVKALAADMQNVSGGALSMGEALKQAVRGVSFNFMSQDLIRLTEGARKASVALGIDFTDAMDRVIRGISKGEVELLDELGIVTRLDTAYQKYAATLGKKADQLTDYQRKVALTTEVLDQLDKKYTAFDVAANNTERLGVATKNLIDTISMKGSKALDSFVGKVADFMEALAPQNSSSKRAAESLKIYNDALKSGNIDQATVALAEYNELQKKVIEETTVGTEAFDRLQEQLGRTREAVENTTVAIVAMMAWMARGAIVTSLTVGLSGLVTVLTVLRAALAGAALASQAFMLFFTAGLGVVSSVGAALTAFGVTVAAVGAPVWALVAAVAAVVAGIGLFIEWLSPGFLGGVLDAAAEGVSWLGDKLRDLALWFGDVTGIKDFVTELTGAQKAVDLASDSILRLENTRANRRLVPSRQAEEAFSPGTPSKVLAVEEERRNLVMMTTEQIEKQKVAQANANIAYANGLQEAATGVKKLAMQLDYAKTPMQELAAKAKELVPTVDLKTGLINQSTIDKARGFFEELQKAGIIASDALFENGKGLEAFAAGVDATSMSLAQLSRSREVVEAQFATTVYGARDEDIQNTQKQIALDSERLAMLSQYGDKLAMQERTELANAIAINREKIKQLEIAQQLLAIERSMELKQESSINQLKLRGALESEILEQKILLLNKEIQAKSGLGQTAEVDALQHKVDLMKEEYKYAKAMEDYERAKIGRENGLADLEVNTSKSLNERDRSANLQKELDYKRQSVALDTQMTELERLRATSELDREQKKLDMKKEAALYSDVSGAASGIAGLEGLTDLQSQFASSVSDMSGTYATFLEQVGDDSMTFTEYLAGNVEAMSNMMQSSVSLANQIYQTMSAEKIASIDREIEAEKRRDGKSAESLAKIKALEAKKIKEETKAKKASVIMSTAAGVMQAFAQMGPFGAPFAAAIAAMGMVQLASIDRAANGQLAALNDGSGTNLSITGGNRTNEVDVSKKANAGELAYLQGASGVGSANNFIPGKSIGGYSAGTSIVVGESGPETITPAMPVNVQPAGSNSGPSIVFSPVLNATAVDTYGMEELLDRYSKHLFNSLEKEMNARNRSLESL